MTLTTKTPEELQTLLATARKSATAIEAELKRRADEKAEKTRTRVRPLVMPNPGVNYLYRHDHDGQDQYLILLNAKTVRALGIDNFRTARVHAYAECMAKVAESWVEHGLGASEIAGYDRINASAWCADMIAGRESTHPRIVAARDAGFID